MSSFIFFKLKLFVACLYFMFQIIHNENPLFQKKSSGVWIFFNFISSVIDYVFVFSWINISLKCIFWWWIIYFFVRVMYQRCTESNPARKSDKHQNFGSIFRGVSGPRYACYENFLFHISTKRKFVNWIEDFTSIPSWKYQVQSRIFFKKYLKLYRYKDYIENFPSSEFIPNI